MAQKSETRAGKARASRNSLGGFFRINLTQSEIVPQAVPDLIATHIGIGFLEAKMSESTRKLIGEQCHGASKRDACASCSAELGEEHSHEPA